MARTAVQDQSHDGRGVGHFFEDGGEHQGAIADRISGDEAKSDLPGERAADETVKEARMRDGRRVFLTDEVKHEVERGDDEQAPDACNPEDNFREFQGRLPRSANRKLQMTQQTANVCI